MRVLEISLLPEEKRVRLTVDMEDPDRFMTSHIPHVTRKLFQILPRLGGHTCHNGKGKSFRQECRNTEIAHLLEHLVIELQLMAQENPDDYLRGETEWNWHVDPCGRYYVTVEYENELLAISSIRLAERILIALDRRDISIDIHAEVARLREMLHIGRDLVETRLAPVASKPKRSWASVPFTPEPALPALPIPCPDALYATVALSAGEPAVMATA